ncbi:unnamed protein product [Rotaria socialis]|uniref:Uncharacterized protein n=2 Tax=Rotaria socialis TaxID=392032 RepID=A0A818GNQ7_9BILA|nr:unnamed protein product [Rotaria socialis]CAF3652210.1 unnamed protein product [Rotaria socialis]
MLLIQLILTFMLGINNQVASSVSPTVTIETADLEDGHPNHQLWKKLTDTGRYSFPGRLFICKQCRSSSLKKTATSKEAREKVEHFLSVLTKKRNLILELLVYEEWNSVDAN